IALVGRKLIHTVGFLKYHTHILRKIFGWIIIIGSLVALFSNIPSAYTSMGESSGKNSNEHMGEANKIGKNEPNTKQNQNNINQQNQSQNQNPEPEKNTIMNGLSSPYPAPDLVKNSIWFNS